ncbi:MAG: penicillin-binding protein, partial [Marinilabiliales bacterium]
MKKESKSFKKLIRFFWIAFSGFIVLLFLWFILISYGVFGFMPRFDELENPKSSLASEGLSSDQKVLGLFYIKNRTIVEFNDLSPFLVEALIATEDSRFKDHSGIDGRSLARVFFKTFLLGKKSAGGGSTISQQLAKNLFPRDGTNILLAKMKEWVVSVQLEKRYTKDEIITMYFNTVEYGNNAYGIKAAAKTYFNKLPSELKLEEAAVLVGLLKGTTMYNPIRNPENSFNRRNTVLSQMNKYDYLSNAELDSLKEIPLVTDFSPPSHNSGKAQYIREYLRLFLTANEPNEDDYSSDEAYEHAKDEWENNPLYGWCNKNEKPNGENYNLYKDGLKIYTTINSKMQMYAEQAVKNHLSKDLQKAFFKEQKSNKKAPFSSKLSDEQVKKIMDNSIKRSERYWNHKRNGLSHDSIIKIFHTPVKTSVFSWDGPKEMIISPYDSILQTKYYLHAGFISIEPQTGYVRSYVGGINYTYFKFDNVSQGKRQVGSTFKPFIYSLIIEKGYSPCTKVPNIEVSFKLPDGKLYTPG